MTMNLIRELCVGKRNLITSVISYEIDQFIIFIVVYSLEEAKVVR